MKTRSFTVLIYKEEDRYIAECPEVGTVENGDTIEEAVDNIREATKRHLETFPAPEVSPRYVTNIEVTYS